MFGKTAKVGHNTGHLPRNKKYFLDEILEVHLFCILPGSPGCEPGSPAAVLAAPRHHRPGSSPSWAVRLRLWVTDRSAAAPWPW